MVKEPVSARYAEALFEMVKPQGRLEEVAVSCEALGSLLRDQPTLREFLENPDVDVPDKLGVLERLLKGAWPADVRAFVQLVLSFDRAPHLVEMTEAFHELMDAERGVLRVRVRTARPLSRPLKTRLAQALTRLRGRTIEMTEETAPELIGGIQVFLDHQLIDGSLATKLSELRQRLKCVRVH